MKVGHNCTMIFHMYLYIDEIGDQIIVIIHNSTFIVPIKNRIYIYDDTMANSMGYKTYTVDKIHCL